MNYENVKLPPGDKEPTAELSPDGCGGCFLLPPNQINKTFILSQLTEVVFMSSSLKFDNRAIHSSQ